MPNPGFNLRSLVFLAVLCIHLCTLPLTVPQAIGNSIPETDDWVDLFNGQDLSGWTPKIRTHELGVNFANTFRVADGLLQVRYDGYDAFNNQFGHLFYAQPFSHYVLHIRYRFVGDQAPGGPRGWAVRNSGVMLHSQTPESMGLDQEFPDSIEAQFLGGLSDGKPRPTANLCTPGTHVEIDGKLFTPHCTPSKSETLDGDQWVDFMVMVLGSGTVRHYVNGAEVLSYARPQLDDGASHAKETKYLDGGYISLQSESHPIDFQFVRILSLVGCTNASATNYKPYAVKSGDCEFEG